VSALYGTLSGDGRAQDRTRCAHREISASARSYDGSVTVTLLKADKDAPPVAIIMVGEGSRVGGREVWRGPLASLMLQGLLKTQEEDMEPPLCARAMGCLCAAHAKGRASNGPCDAREDVTP
jgi:hypothetical protein